MFFQQTKTQTGKRNTYTTT